MKQRPCVMIIAGEASGDHHGAKVVRCLRAQAPHLFFCGIGGPDLQAAGVRILVSADSVSVIGFTEMFAKLTHQIRGLVKIKRLLRILRPDLLILIDFPEFNLRVAPAAKALGIPVLYYISPQIWAWRSGRVNQIRRCVDRMAVILPFEAEFYRQHRVPVEFVGHPLLDNNLPSVETVLQRPEPRPPVLGLLPGSRDREISRHLPVMLAAGDLLRHRFPGLRLMVSLVPWVDRGAFRPLLKRYNALDCVQTDIGTVFKNASAAVAASGTVTLEAALHGLPLVIVYRMSPLSYQVGRALVKVRHVGLVNLIARRELMPELLQQNATPEKIAGTLGRMLRSSARLQSLRRRLLDIRQALGGPGASQRVAEMAREMLP